MSLYDVLGVAPSADEATLRQAFLAQARRHHPDRHGGDPARMRAVNHAWSVLGDPEQRARYDRTLVASPAPEPSTAAPRFRPGHEPDPRYPAHEDLDLEDDDDLFDGHPVRVTVALPRWLRLLPAGTLAGAVGVAFVGTVVASEPLFALGLMLGILSFLFFISAPFVALLSGRLHDEEAEEPPTEPGAPDG